MYPACRALVYSLLHFLSALGGVFLKFTCTSSEQSVEREIPAPEYTQNFVFCAYCYGGAVHPRQSQKVNIFVSTHLGSKAGLMVVAEASFMSPPPPKNDRRKYFLISLHERMLPTSAGVEPGTSWSPVGRRIHLSHRGKPVGSGNSVKMRACRVIRRLWV